MPAPLVMPAPIAKLRARNGRLPPLSFTEVYLAHVGVADFRSNPRGELGTRTATLHREGVRKLRGHWIYKA